MSDEPILLMFALGALIYWISDGEITDPNFGR
jgi:hypothetical protein